MKSLLFRSFLLIILFSQSPHIFSWGSLSSADYVRTLNRSASLGSVDALLFNPSGIMTLQDGIFFQISGGIPMQMMSVENQDLIDLGKSNAKNYYNFFGPILPGGNFVLKKSRYAIYAGLLSTDSESWQIILSKVNPLTMAMAMVRQLYLPSYKFQDVSYELSAGGVILFSKELFMNFGSSIGLKFKNMDVNYPIIISFYKEEYSLSENDFGLTFSTGLTYKPKDVPGFSFSLNANSGFFSFQRERVSSAFLNTRRGPRPSTLDNYPIDNYRGFTISYIPARIDIGFRFEVNSFAVVQITSQGRIAPDRIETYGMNLDFDGMYWGFNIGAGADFNINRFILVGCGLRFNRETPHGRIYKNVADYISDIRLMSMDVGFGVVLKEGGKGMFDFGVSFMYPMYINIQKGQGEVIKFSVPDQQDMFLGDLIISVGLTVKLPSGFLTNDDSDIL